MAPLEQVQDIEVLRACAILYRDELKRMAAENARLKNEQAQASDGQAFLSDRLRDQLTKLESRYFGFGREKLAPSDEAGKGPRPVGHDQQKLKLHNRRSHREKSGEKEVGKPEGPSKAAAAVLSQIDHDFSMDDLRRENESRAITSLDGGAPVIDSQAPWQKIDRLTSDTVEITITERTYQRVVHRQAKYRLKDEYNPTGKEVIITAPGPAKLKPGCQYSIDFALAVVSDKYEYHLPLERQRRRMEAAGLTIDVKTLYTLVRSVAEHCEVSVVPKIRRDILADFCATHLDESTWPILSTKTRGQMWVLTNRIGSLYRFEPTRSGKVAEELLEGYQGAVLTDGFSGYNRVKRIEGIRHAMCWAHARREFHDRKGDYPKESTEFGRLVEELYAIEDRAESFEQLGHLRATESKLVVERLRSWLWETKSRYLGSEGLSSAIDYCLKFWPELTLFLRDLSVPLDNNSAERAERHVVMGRKNFGGSKTIDGADVAATLYTVIESCKKSGLQAREYLRYVITERWHRREPKSPMELSHEKFGKDDAVVFPAKSEWRIPE